MGYTSRYERVILRAGAMLIFSVLFQFQLMFPKELSAMRPQPQILRIIAINQLWVPPSALPPLPNIINMEKQQLLQEIHLRNIEIVQNAPSARKQQRPPNSNRTLIRLYLTRQTLEECLETLDIFKEILQDPVQKSKLVRDVNKNLQLKVYDEAAVIYNRGDVSEGFYMVIKGRVSLCLPVYKQNTLEGSCNEERILQEQEIDSFGEGVGFGEAEFIHGKKRSLVARAKENDTVVGMIEGLAFEEIIELYKQRVYFKKMDMFGRCPLLKNLQPYQLQFVVNNAKPVTVPISKEIVRQNDKVKSLLLITEGEVELRRNQPLLKQPFGKYRTNSRTTIQSAQKEKIKIKSIVIGVLQEGQFIGDDEMVLQRPYKFSAFAKSQKVRLYICDERIISSQMSVESFSSALQHYKSKEDYRDRRTDIYREVKSRLQKKMETEEKCALSEQQKQIKRMIAYRYIEDVPSAIGRLSPREITKMVDRKYARLKSEHSKSSQKTNYLPQLNIIEPAKRLKADERSYSPLLKKHQQHERRATEGDYSTPAKKISSTAPHQQSYEYQVLSGPSEYRRSQSSKPLLVFMRPFTKKVLGLHERLAQEYNSLKQEKEGTRSRRHLDNFSVIEMRRVYEFVNKLKTHKKQ